MVVTKSTFPVRGRSPLDVAASVVDGFPRLDDEDGMVDMAYDIEPIAAAAATLTGLVPALVTDIVLICNERQGLPIGGELAHAVAGAGEMRAWGHLHFATRLAKPGFAVSIESVDIDEVNGMIEGTIRMAIKNPGSS